MLWVKRLLRGDLVYASANADGSVVAEDGRVAIKYKLGATQKVYRASERNLTAVADTAVIEEADGDGPPAPAPVAKKARKPAALLPPVTEVTPGTIIIYTDGACVGNPGPMGIGAVVADGPRRLELSEFLGHGTNNIAELTAIQRALEEVPAAHRARPVRLHTDSAYAIGLLTKPWKPKANVELVAEMREQVKGFADLVFVKVAGHAGVPENERCDELAGDAIKTRTSTRVESVSGKPA